MVTRKVWNIVALLGCGVLLACSASGGTGGGSPQGVDVAPPGPSPTGPSGSSTALPPSSSSTPPAASSTSAPAAPAPISTADAGGPASVDGAAAPTGSGIACPTAPCGPGTQCCEVAEDGGLAVACLAQCPDGAGPLSCDGPSDCSGATPICCATAVLTGGSIPNCTVGSVSTTCVDTCTEQLSLSCTATQTTRVCVTKTDCAGDPDGNTDCCTFSESPKPFCASPLIAAFATSCAQ